MTAADSDKDGEPIPPDGGFGWVVVGCVFFITFLSFGIIYSVGIMFDVLMAEFNCSKSEMTVVGSIALSMQCFLGPFVSLLQQRFSTRIMVITGVIIVSIGFISSTFAPTLYVLYFTFGVLGGLGMALIYLPVTVMVSLYFCRRRSLATALGGIGSYVGCFIHPYLIRFLISLYNWRGALLILGALELNSIGAALLLRPVPVRKTKKTVTEEAIELETQVDLGRNKILISESSNALAAFIEENIAGCQAVGNTTPEANRPPEVSPFRTMSDSGDDDSSLGMSGPNSQIDTGRASVQSVSSGTAAAVQKVTSPPAARPSSFSKRQFSQGGLRPGSSTVRRKAAGQRQISEQPHTNTTAVGDTSVDLDARRSLSRTALQKQQSLVRASSKLSRLSSFQNLYTSDVLHLPRDAGTPLAMEETSANAGAIQTPSRQISEPGKFKEDSTVLEEVKEQLETTPPIEAPKSTSAFQRFLQVLAPYFAHFKDPKFTSFFTTNLMKGLIYYTPSMFIVGWGTQLGMSVEQTTLLMSLVGIGNIIGRPVMAFISDLLATHRMALLAAMVGINGTVTLSTVVFPHFYYLAFFVFQFAFLIGGGQTLLTPILADMVPLSELGFAFGILIAAEGAAILVGPPLLGLFPTYPATFAASGLILLSSAVVLVIVAYIERIFIFLIHCARGTKGAKEKQPEKVIASADA